MMARRAASVDRAAPAVAWGTEADLVDAVARVQERMHRVVEEAAQQARAASRPVLKWVTVPLRVVDPARVFAAAIARAQDPMLWWQPDEEFALVGIGRAWSFSAEGPARFSGARDAWQALMATTRERDVVESEADGRGSGAPDPFEWGSGPIAMAGFAFDHRPAGAPEWHAFPPASLVLPEILIRLRHREAWLTASVVVPPDAGHPLDAPADIDDALESLIPGLTAEADARPWRDQPAVSSRHRHGAVVELRSAAEWKTIVRSAAAAVRGGKLQKVVVARGVRVTATDIEAAGVLERLRAEYPSCTVFAFARGERCFVGATPERLVRVRHDEVGGMALAGSAPRGADDEEDQRLGAALLASGKDRIEHAIVVDAMREALAGTCASVTAAAAPTLLKVKNVQHLHTPMAAQLRPGVTILDLVDRLHPSPAVGGVPRDDAMAWLREREGLGRGWYAGPVGWIDRAGEGEFAVAIRCALLGRDEALLYTGCGIVADSDPDAEYVESRLKLRPMLSALRANGRS